MTQPIRAIRGMNDILPTEAYLWEYFEHTVSHWLHCYGYQQIRTPILENTRLFIGAIGEVTDIVEKEMYSFEDRLNGEHLTLRPEGTAACVRAVVEHHLAYNAPQRLWYMGPMFRHERPQKGRYRQFHQIGAEAIGYAGPDIDAEQIMMVQQLWQQLGLHGITLQINTLGDLSDRARYRDKLIAYLEQHQDILDAEAKRRLHSNPLRILDSKVPQMQPVIENAPQLIHDLGQSSLNQFEDLQRLLRISGIPYQVNPRLVRGLDYYNAVVYEWVATGSGSQNTLCAGGRYDHLIEKTGGKPTPACGYAMGMERVLALLLEQKISIPQPCPHAYCIYVGQGADQQAIVLTQALRQAGLAVILHCGGGNFKAQMRRADQSGARFALIIGENEVSTGSVTIKPLRTTEAQQNLPQADCLAFLQRHST